MRMTHNSMVMAGMSHSSQYNMLAKPLAMRRDKSMGHARPSVSSPPGHSGGGSLEAMMADSLMGQGKCPYT